MRFYTQQHKFYCGIDLHARSMYLCILNQEGQAVVHRNMKADPALFLKVIAPYREEVVVAVECIFTWYWLADLCAREGIPFVLGHALYMKAIHGGKAKNDKYRCAQDRRALSRWDDPPSLVDQLVHTGRARERAGAASGVSVCAHLRAARLRRHGSDVSAHCRDHRFRRPLAA